MTISETLRDVRSWLAPGGLLAMLLGGLLAVPLVMYADDWLASIDDTLRPVSTGRVIAQRRLGDEMHFRLLVTRHRPECLLAGVYAYGISPEGYTPKANIERLDARATENMPPGVEIDVGEFRLWPVGGAKRIVIHVHHHCGSRLVSTKLAEVPT